MKMKKLFAAALAAGFCAVTAVTPVQANVLDKDGNSVNQAYFTVADFYDSDKDVTEVKSYTFVLGCDTALSVSNAFNGQVVLQNAVDWEWTQRSFSADTSVNDWQGNPYNYALTIIDENTAELKIPAEGVMALKTQNDQLIIGDWNGYVLTVKDVKFDFGEVVEEPVVTETPVEEPEVTEAPVEEPEVTEAPVEEPEVTEAPVEEPEVTEAPVEEPEVTEAPVEEPEVTEEPAETPAEEDTEEPAEVESAKELPKTGLVSGLAFAALGSALVAAGVVVKNKKED